ncbi:MAG: penicillin-binding protein 1C [Fibrobacteria bacterium]|nr:penicillin-binding protein 1C [Fibrobacteria bacterium]
MITVFMVKAPRDLLLSGKWSRTFMLLSGALLLAVLCYVLGRPSSSLLEQVSFSRVIKDRHGEVLRMILSKDDKYRVYTSLQSFHPLLKEAVLMKEDRHFYRHPGFNPISLIRAFYASYIQGGKKIGGSTINMQLARLYYHLNTRTVFGKLKQIFLGCYMELYFDKDDIFEAYLNLVPCGGNIEGFGSAALIYFEKDTRELTLQEILFLALLPQNPCLHKPGSHQVHPELIKGSRRLLSFWKSYNHSPSLKEVDLDMKLIIGCFKPFKAPHYAQMLLNEFPGQTNITGTLDMHLQRLITRLTKRYVNRKKSTGVYNAAVLLADSERGQVLSVLGSVDFFNTKIEGQVNGAMAQRSPGSTLKPFIYALAMEQGLIHPKTMLQDAPTSFSEYSPDNYQSDFEGPIKAWKALITSRNIPAVYLASKLKDPDLYDFLLGTGAKLKHREHYGLSLVLGGAEFSMYQLAAMYGILANKGIYKPLDNIISPPDTLWRPSYQALSEEVSYLTRKILEKNPRPHSNLHSSAHEHESSVAFKTGTSIGFKDCWSVGLFEKYICVVWLGNFNGYGNPEFVGRQLASPLMFEIIDAIRAEKRNDVFVESIPEGISQIKVCQVSGQIAKKYCKKKVVTRFIPGTSPITECTICRKIYIQVNTGLRTLKQEGPGIKSEVYEFWPSNLLKLFHQAGIPRRTPPPFDPREKINLLQLSGMTPEIVSPQKNMEYILRQGDKVFNDLPLRANTDADVKEIYWFLGNRFIGKAEPDEKVYWPLTPGTFQITVVDDHGRSDTRSLKIGYSD